MARLIGGLALLALMMPGWASAAAGSYVLVRGESWQGVTIGGETPRSVDSICHRARCYPLHGSPPLPRHLKARYGIDRVDFDTLAGLEGVSRAGDWLYLPRDLGEALYEAGLRSSLLNAEGPP